MTESRHVLGLRVDCISTEEAVDQILAWAIRGTRTYVCAANVHMVMEAYDSPPFRTAVNSAGMLTPDGMPLVWALRSLGVKQQQRVYGPDLMLTVCKQAAARGVTVGLYGGRPQALELLQSRLTGMFPGLKIGFAWSPPFRPLSDEEDERVVKDVTDAGVQILFVGLGCPKQERWMAEHKGKLSVVMVGVGAAFDFHSGQVKQAPRWMQHSGLEWSFRLLAEPRRLWRRYLKHNPRFAVLFVAERLGLKRIR